MCAAPVEGPLITADDIAASIRAAGVDAGDVVLAHTSLKAFGWVCGGPVVVINALKTALTPDGTVVMPALSADYSDPCHWTSPPVPEDWWPSIRETMPAYDPALTPTTGLGRTPEAFHDDPDVKRSDHPQVSFAAWGKLRRRDRRRS